MEYYLVIEENEILPFTTTQMDLEGIMLCEINQTEKDKYCMISLICEILKTNKQIQRTDCWLLEVGVVGKMGEGSQKVQPSSYKINKSWACNVQHGDNS